MGGVSTFLFVPQKEDTTFYERFDFHQKLCFTFRVAKSHRHETKGAVIMTSVVSPATPKIVGKALYLELVANPAIDEESIRSVIGWQHKGTKQVLIFPEYQDDLGKVHEAVAMSRIVSENTPRSQWDTTYLRHPKPLDTPDPEDKSSYYNDYFQVQTYSNDEWRELPIVAQTESKKLAIELYLRGELIGTRSVGEGEERKSIPEQGWVVRDEKPFAVELTDEDYDDLHRKSKTPQAVIRRINKVRESISSFPNKLG